MGRLFGTDGIRGVANQELTPELAFHLGRAGAHILTAKANKAQIIVGRDTRISGEMLEAALMAGILSVGASVHQVGVMPTPAIAYLVRKFAADAGVVISASHNPVQDNGIKFFSASGFKLPDAVEDEIEAHLYARGLPRPLGKKVGRVYPAADAAEEYLRYLASIFPPKFAGLRLVIDCANGAASHISPEIFRRLGAEVIPICNSPNGLNINDNCGSTHPELLQRTVLKEGAHMGFAHDGDADRVLACDEKGQLIDGDQIMCISALRMAATGQLRRRILITTVMSNLGLERALKEKGIEVRRTQVGDRYVLAKMQRWGANLGGEQSGHVIFLDYNTTGDGIITALKLATIVVETGNPLSQLAAAMPRLPQVQYNVLVSRKENFSSNSRLQEAIQTANAAFAGTGRVLVRPSGTEPKVRVMVEGEDEKGLEEIAGRLVRLIEEELG
ncbi:MAG: phosphoglucosamine mutase [Firmicutes bacterium]|nr:phosphoglucosamine mutase [Bacillota bacterium]